jgi:hypothetical protein
MNREQAKQAWLDAEVALAAQHNISVEELRRLVARDLEMREARRLGIDPAMIAACDTATMQGIALRDNRAPSGPSAEGIIPATQTLSSVHSAAGMLGSHNGWVMPAPIQPPAGVALCDKLMDHADAQDRVELAERLAKQKRAMMAAQQAGEAKP